MVKVVPVPGDERKLALPPCSSATFWTTSRPIPVPSVPLDEKNSSKTRLFISSGMPMPLSSTSSTAVSSPFE
jgi:hypothetical protein